MTISRVTTSRVTTSRVTKSRVTKSRVTTCRVHTRNRLNRMERKQKVEGAGRAEGQKRRGESGENENKME